MITVSYALYGSQSEYLFGMVCNAKRAPRMYPGCRVLVNHDETVPRACLDELSDLGVVLVPRDELGLVGAQRMLWRFLDLPTSDVLLSRDADSTIYERETTAVTEWLGSGCVCHSMHDSPSHLGVNLMGGMIGLRGGPMWSWVPEHISAFCNRVKERPAIGFDQAWLSQYVWPLVDGSVWFSGLRGHEFAVPIGVGEFHVGASMDMKP